MQIQRLLYSLLGPMLGVFLLAAPARAETLSIVGTNLADRPTLGGGQLKVFVSAPPASAPGQYVLFVNGRAVTGLAETTYQRDGGRDALVFRLRRNAGNVATWAALMGSPTSTSRRVTVSLGTDAQGAATIVGDGKSDALELTIVKSPVWQIALLAMAAMAAFVWLAARRSGMLKDNLLPQIASHRQTYSLGRWQMAFWFVMVGASYIALFIVFGDTDTLSAQALGLMGLSAATGLGAIVVDVAKDTPADAANRGLSALGLKSYDDVLRVQAELAERQVRLQSSPPADPLQLEHLKAEIRDRMLTLNTHREITRPFETQGWFKDLTSDLNGASLHRLQVFFWTWVIGLVFLYELYSTFAMPALSPTLLTLTGISGAGYVGFKYPEPQS